MKKLGLVILVVILGFSACEDSKDLQVKSVESSVDSHESQMSIDNTEFEMPDYIKEWVGVYEFGTIQNGKPTKHAFEIRNHCSNDKIFGGFYCEIGYAKNGSKFDDFSENFYTEKPNDDYHTVRIIVFHSATKATIQAFSLEYNNDFCNVEVEKQGQTITLKSGECKNDDFALHNEIFGKYVKILDEYDMVVQQVKNAIAEANKTTGKSNNKSTQDSHDWRESKSQ